MGDNVNIYREYDFNKDIKRLETVLDGIVEKHQQEQIESMEKHIRRLFNLYKENRKKNESIYHFFVINRRHMESYEILKEVLKLKYSMKDEDFLNEDKVKIKAKDLANSTFERFKLKAIEKTRSILLKKAPTKIQAKTRVGHNEVTGEITFLFTDGSQFTLYQSIVFSSSKKGVYFYRYPTTFHDVTFPDGMRKKKVSQKEMNEMFI